MTTMPATLNFSFFLPRWHRVLVWGPAASLQRGGSRTRVHVVYSHIPVPSLISKVSEISSFKLWKAIRWKIPPRVYSLNTRTPLHIVQEVIYMHVNCTGKGLLGNLYITQDVVHRLNDKKKWTQNYLIQIWLWIQSVSDNNRTIIGGGRVKIFRCHAHFLANYCTWQLMESDDAVLKKNARISLDKNSLRFDFCGFSK